MALDRDLAVALVRALGRPARTGWEMTAATGVRGLRLLRETEGFRAFAFSEASPRSLEVLRANVADEPRATAHAAGPGGAPPGAPFDLVDIDPYGSPLPFLREGLAATRTGGILGVAATDLPVLAGAQPAACRRRYGAAPVRGRLGPEGALRILLMVLAREARREGRAIRAQLAYVGGHHVRAYVELCADDAPADPVGLLEPSAWDGPPLDGAGPFGPLWHGPLVDPELAGRLAVPTTAARPAELARLLELLREDAGPIPVFYYEANRLAASLRLSHPPPLDALLAGLRDAGHRAGRTHVRPEGIRTDAPRSTVERVARAISEAAQSQNARVRA